MHPLIRISAVPIAAALSGCMAPIAIGTGGAAGALAGYVTAQLTNPQTDISLANGVLAADAPIKADWCKAHPAVTTRDPALATYCAHIPTSLLSAAATWAQVLAVWQAP